MKDFSLLVFITQLGLSVVLPLAGFTLIGVWLRERFSLGVWVVIAGLLLGIFCAAEGFRNSLRAMERLSKDKKEEKPPLSFNDHD